MSVKRLTVDIAKEITNNAISKLIEEFKENPTIYLEEKHLHNEFDRIFRNYARNEFPHFIKTKDDINFPIFMNEYATFHKYKAEEFFLKTYDDPKGGNTGSLDFVVLDPDWISNHDYIECVNKDEVSRKKIREEIEINKKSPFLVTIEFKFMHFSTDQGRKSNTEDSKLEDIHTDIIGDAWKQIHEKARSSHVLYFNSVIPINSDNIHKLLRECLGGGRDEDINSDDDKVLREKLKNRCWKKETKRNSPIVKFKGDPSINEKNLQIRYTQAGVISDGKSNKNFNGILEFYSIAYDYRKPIPESIKI